MYVVKGVHHNCYHAAIVLKMVANLADVIVAVEPGVDINNLVTYYNDMFSNKLYEFFGYKRIPGAHFINNTVSTIKYQKIENHLRKVDHVMVDIPESALSTIHAIEDWIWQYMFDNKLITLDVASSTNCESMVWLLGRENVTRRDVKYYSEAMSHNNLTMFDMYVIIKNPVLSVHEVIIPRIALLIIMDARDIEDVKDMITVCDLDLYMCIWGEEDIGCIQKKYRPKHLHILPKVNDSNASLNQYALQHLLQILSAPTTRTYNGLILCHKLSSGLLEQLSLNLELIKKHCGQQHTLWVPNARASTYLHVGGCRTCNNESYLKKHDHHTDDICSEWFYGSYEVMIHALTALTAFTVFSKEVMLRDAMQNYHCKSSNAILL